MKIIFIFLSFLTFLTSQSQKSILISQDIKLAVMSDNYGNKPFTPDLILSWKDDGKYLVGIEYARLRDDYYRIFAGVPIEKRKGKFEFICDFNLGIIFHKQFFFYLSPSIDFDLFYNFGKTFSIGIQNQTTLRTEYALFRNSFFIIFKIKIVKKH